MGCSGTNVTEEQIIKHNLHPNAINTNTNYTNLNSNAYLNPNSINKNDNSQNKSNLQEDELIKQFKMGLCKVSCSELYINSIGILCKIPFPDTNKLLPVIIIQNHVADKILQNNLMNLVENDKELKLFVQAKYNFSMNLSLCIDIKIQRKQYVDRKNNIAIFELLEKDGYKPYLNYFLNIYDFINNNEIIQNIEPYAFFLNYDSYDSISYTPIKLNSIIEEKDIIEYESEKDFREFSPIIDIKTFTLIGIHKISFFGKEKQGIYIKNIIKEFYKEDLMINEPGNQLVMNYGVFKDNKELKVFGDIFVKNNKDKCKYIVEVKYVAIGENEKKVKKKFSCPLYNDVKELSSIYKLPRVYPDQIMFKITLIGIKNITNISHIFDGCKNLIGPVNINELDTSKMTDMSFMFYGCFNLQKLSDISNFNTENVTNMEVFFGCCPNLLVCPDISKWNTKKCEKYCWLF